jgi:uncharacterized protein YegP (UPF0339 family)
VTNGPFIAAGKSYERMASVVNGIESVKRNALTH